MADRKQAYYLDRRPGRDRPGHQAPGIRRATMKTIKTTKTAGRLRALLMAGAVVAATAGLAASPALAQDWRRDHDGRGEGRDGGRGEWREAHEGYGYGYGYRPYAYARPGYGYYNPYYAYAPSYYSPPGISFVFPIRYSRVGK